MILRTTLVALALLAAPAQAAPISYDEAVDGDLTPSPSSQLFNLEPGANTVSGSTSLSFQTGIDLDAFSIVIGQGETLVSITFAWIASTEGPVIAAGTSFGLGRDGQPASLGFQDIPLSTVSPVGVFAPALPLGEGTYQVRNLFAFLLCTASPCSIDADYVWTLNVRGTDVPEPGALGLLGLGAMGLAMARRRA